MGTTGTGRFRDYDKGGGKRPGKGSGGSGEGGGKVNECEKAIGDILLEEVASCQYLKKRKNLPPSGTIVFLRERLEGGRLAIETAEHELIGYLPTRYNYLRRCMEQEYRYSGNIIQSSVSPIPIIRIDLAPRL